MTGAQATALAEVISRGAGYAVGRHREHDDPEGIAAAALEYARASGWERSERVGELERVLGAIVERAEADLSDRANLARLGVACYLARNLLARGK